MICRSMNKVRPLPQGHTVSAFLQKVAFWLQGFGGHVGRGNLPPFRSSRFLLLLALGLAQQPASAEDVSTGASKAPEATTYQIRNVKFSGLLRPRDANNADGTTIVLYSAQPWKCMTWRLQPAGESAFHLKNLFTGKTFCADTNVSGPRQNVTQLPLAKDGNGAPAWQFVRLEDGSYKIADAKTGNVLTAVKAAGAYEATIVTASWQNLDEQKWRLEKMDPKDLTM